MTSIHKSNTISSIDITAYFKRIGYFGDQSPTITNLTQIVRLHTESIAFENFDYLLRIPILLDIESIQSKLIWGGRGGGCIEQNLLLGHVLKELGYGVTGISARVLWQVPEAITAPRHHRLNLIKIQDQLCIADVGFIGMTPTAPILLQPDVEQKTSLETFKVTKLGTEFILHVKIQEAWRPVYQFGLQEQLLPDDETINWYVANHPDSFVIHDLIAAIASPDCRYIFHNTRYTEYHLNGKIERKNITEPILVEEIFKNTFGLAIPDQLDLDAIIHRLLLPKI